MKLEPGDYVQFTEWFTDVYAQVLHVTGDPINRSDEFWAVAYCQHGKYGRTRYVGRANGISSSIRVMVKQAGSWPHIFKVAGVLHGDNIYHGACGWVSWPEKMKATSNTHKNRPQDHPGIVLRYH